MAFVSDGLEVAPRTGFPVTCGMNETFPPKAVALCALGRSTGGQLRTRGSRGIARRTQSVMCVTQTLCVLELLGISLTRNSVSEPLFTWIGTSGTPESGRS